MKRIIQIIFLSFLALAPLFAQDSEIARPEKTEPSQKNFNVDAKGIYGQHNNLNTSFSIIQNFDGFAYQLNSDLKSSNDFGYSNTGFYSNSIGFTGRVDAGESLKFMPQIDVSTSSYGMYLNPDYSREQKDKIDVAVKSEMKSTTSRLELNLKAGQYVHRLVPLGGASDGSSVYKINPEMKWEYVISASNSISLNSSFARYFYDGFRDDMWTSNDLAGSFKVTEYLKIAAGPILNWNRDSKVFASGKGSISTSGLKYFSSEILYYYDMLPFRPENVFYERNFLLPSYNLPPAKVHHAEIKCELDFRNGGGEVFLLKRVRIKGTGIFEKSDNLYNYYSIHALYTGPDVLGVAPLRASMYRGKADLLAAMSIAGKELNLSLNYQFDRYISDKNITYRPEHSGGVTVKYGSQEWEVVYENRLLGSVYILPDSSKKMEPVVLGSFVIQVRTFGSLFLYGKVDNIYGSSYNLRYGYPEPGRTFLGGLRILL